MHINVYVLCTKNADLDIKQNVKYIVNIDNVMRMHILCYRLSIIEHDA